MTHVVLGYRREPKADVHITFSGAPQSVFDHPMEDLRPWPRARSLAVENPPGAAKRAPKLAALFPGIGAWILRRSLAGPILDGIPGVTLRPIALADQRRKVVDDDFVFIDVRNWWPLDVGAKLRDPRWRRPPPFRVFRVAEQPRLIFIDEDLAAALHQATRGLVGRFQPDAGHLPDGFFGGLFPAKVPAEPKAAEAFFADDRAAVLKSPRYATWLARSIDGKPRADTRRAALRSPMWAAVYAILVDRRGSAAAEKAVRGDGMAAHFYTAMAAFDIPASLKPTLEHDGWGDNDIREQKAKLAEARRYLRNADWR